MLGKEAPTVILQSNGDYISKQSEEACAEFFSTQELFALFLYDNVDNITKEVPKHLLPCLEFDGIVECDTIQGHVK